MKPSDDVLSKFAVYTGKDAQTIPEMGAETGLGDSALRRFAAKMVEGGKWEVVTVRRKQRFTKAYVRKEK